MQEESSLEREHKEDSLERLERVEEPIKYLSLEAREDAHSVAKKIWIEGRRRLGEEEGVFCKDTAAPDLRIYPEFWLIGPSYIEKHFPKAQGADLIIDWNRKMYSSEGTDRNVLKERYVFYPSHVLKKTYHVHPYRSEKQDPDIPILTEINEAGIDELQELLKAVICSESLPVIRLPKSIKK